MAKEPDNHVIGLPLRIRSEIADFRTELKADLAELRAELKADINSLRADFNSLRADVASVLLTMQAKADAEHKATRDAVREQVSGRPAPFSSIIPASSATAC